MKLFRATTTIKGVREPLVDWFESEGGSEGDLRQQWCRECQRCGVPVAKATVAFVECDPQSMKPLQDVKP